MEKLFPNSYLKIKIEHISRSIECKVLNSLFLLYANLKAFEI